VAVAPQAPAPVEDWDAPTAARVRCIVTTLPHTHLKGLALGEIAEVPIEVANLMKSKGQVEVL
jgi:hypothetical protein